MTDVAPMVVSDPLAAFARGGMVKVIAPAKTNLYLEIQGKRADGYHDVITVMHALSLHDVLHLDCAKTETGGLQIEIACYAREGLDPLVVDTKDNIVFKAITLFAEKLARAENEVISVRIEKHIPQEAGLGGGSSDAAAALVGTARLWGIDPEAPELLASACELGADVAFFLKGGCACYTGIGETFNHALEPMKKSAVLIKPAEGVSTRAAYAAFDKSNQPIDAITRGRALGAMRAEEVPLRNNLTGAAHSILPELVEITAWLNEQVGVEASFLSGSGSVIVALCDTFDDACRVVPAARQRGWWARTTVFCSAAASVAP